MNLVALFNSTFGELYAERVMNEDWMEEVLDIRLFGTAANIDDELLTDNNWLELVSGVFLGKLGQMADDAEICITGMPYDEKAFFEGMNKTLKEKNAPFRIVDGIYTAI